MKDKINPTNPDEVRKWEERIVRFEGWVYNPGLNNPSRHSLPDCWTDGIDFLPMPPSYSTSLPDLFRVLRKMSTEKHVQWYLDGIQYIGSDYRVICTLKKGGETICIESDYIPEQAIFTAICQYLRKYYPTVGEEQERIEREASFTGAQEIPNALNEDPNRSDDG